MVKRRHAEIDKMLVLLTTSLTNATYRTHNKIKVSRMMTSMYGEIHDIRRMIQHGVRDEK